MKRLPIGLASLTLILSGVAPAAILYSGTQNIDIPTDFDGIYLTFNDVDNPADMTPAFSNPGDGPPAAWDVNFFFGGTGIATSDTFQPVTASTATNSTVQNLAWNDMVGPGGFDTFPSGFSGSSDHLDSEFTSGQQGYIGFQVDFSGGTHYGWMNVTLRDDGNVGTIHAWAWDNDPGVKVTIIPEASAAGVSAFLLLSAALFHRRRRA